MKPRRAYTMIELTMVVVVAAILAVFAFSDADVAADEEGEGAGRTFEGDVQFARGQSLARPDDPTVIKIDPENNKYWLARQSAPDTPILHPQKKTPYVVTFGPAGPSGYKHVKMVAHDFGGDDMIIFDGLGNIDQDGPAVLQLASGGAEYEVAVSPASASCTINGGFTMNLIGVTSGGQSAGGGGGAIGHTLQPPEEPIEEVQPIIPKL